MAVAIFFVRTTIVSRRKGQSALACAAYRSGQKLEDLYYGTTRDYTKKQGVIGSGIEAPEGCPPWVFDREKLYWEIEKTEDSSTRRNEAQLLREFVIAIPWELKTQSIEISRQICQDNFTNSGMVADWAVHDPSKYGDTRNIHCHILVSMRKMDSTGFHKTKERSWNTKKAHSQIKEKICTLFNQRLKDLGLSPNRDSRSYREQGLDIRATRHKGPKRSAIERKGLPLYIDSEIKNGWTVNILRKAIAIDESRGYKLIAKALSGNDEDKTKAIDFYKTIEEKWIRNIAIQAPVDANLSDSEKMQRASALFQSNEVFSGIREGKDSARTLFSKKLEIDRSLGR